MKTVILYADVALIICIVTTYPLLWLAARRCGVAFSYKRAIISSVLSCVALITEFALRLPEVFLLLFELISYCAEIAAAFGKRRFFSVLAFYTGENLILSGFCSLFANNGYIGAETVIIGTILIVIVVSKERRRNIPRNDVYCIAVIIDGKECMLEAFLDTGNLLIEPVSQCPVVILNSRFDAGTMKASRPIVIRTVNGESVIYAMKPQKIKVLIDNEWKSTGDVAVAFSDKIKYDAIIGSCVIDCK